MIFYSDIYIYIYNTFKFIYYIETIFLQIFLIYIILILLYNNNIYYILLYFFIIIIFFGVIICYIQCELFTGFLWVTEFTVIFIILILLFYLNIDGLHFKYNSKINNFYYNISFLLLLLYIYYNNIPQINELNNLEFYNFIYLYEDYYEALNNNYMNDFSPLFISYYSINSYMFIIIMLLLFLASLICVTLYKNNKNNSKIKLFYILSIYKSNINLSNQIFIKKQNLNQQSNLKISLLMFNGK